jgi:hypothetical protein
MWMLLSRRREVSDARVEVGGMGKRDAPVVAGTGESSVAEVKQRSHRILMSRKHGQRLQFWRLAVLARRRRRGSSRGQRVETHELVGAGREDVRIGESQHCPDCL